MNNKVHIPTVFVISILTIVFVAGGIVWSVNANNKVVEKNTIEIEKNRESNIKQDNILTEIQIKFEYIQNDISEVKVAQKEILKAVKKLNNN